LLSPGGSQKSKELKMEVGPVKSSLVAMFFSRGKLSGPNGVLFNVVELPRTFKVLLRSSLSGSEKV
jgi:hypothetical protein